MNWSIPMHWEMVYVWLGWVAVLLAVAGLIAAFGHRSTRALDYAKNVASGAASAFFAWPLALFFLWLFTKFVGLFPSSIFHREILSQFTTSDGTVVTTYARGGTLGSLVAVAGGLLLLSIVASFFWMGLWTGLRALFTGRLPDWDKAKKPSQRGAPKPGRGGRVGPHPA